MNSVPYFLQCVIQSKADNDWRAFLYYRPNFNSPEELEIRDHGAEDKRYFNCCPENLWPTFGSALVSLEQVRAHLKQP